MLISFVVRKGTNTVANLLPAAPSKQKANIAKWKSFDFVKFPHPD